YLAHRAPCGQCASAVRRTRTVGTGAVPPTPRLAQSGPIGAPAGLHAVSLACLDPQSACAVAVPSCPPCGSGSRRLHGAALSLPGNDAIRALACPQVLAIGVAPLTLSIWQTTTLLAILFHHSNVEIPLSIERWLCRFIVTPRM